MKTLKLSIPTSSTVDLSQYTGNSRAEWCGWRIHANDGIESADAWIVLDSVPDRAESCVVPEGNLWLATGEVIQADDYYLSRPSRQAFLDQFDRILTSQSVLSDKAEKHPPFLPWMVNANHGPSITSAHVRDVHSLRSMPMPDKTRTISIICSTKVLRPEQALRLKFLEKLTSRFAKQIDWFGNGVMPLKEKWDGIAPYKYSIALENQSSPHVITEKLFDVFIGFGLPIYWGAPNVAEYFNPDGLVQIDIRDWKSSCAAIERLLDEDPFEAALPMLLENRHKALNEHHFLTRLCSLLDQKRQIDSPMARRVVRSDRDLSGPRGRVVEAASQRITRVVTRLASIA